MTASSCSAIAVVRALLLGAALSACTLDATGEGVDSDGAGGSPGAGSTTGSGDLPSSTGSGSDTGSASTSSGSECGDGSLSPGEDCEYLGDVAPAGCVDCRFAGSCGDGTLGPREVCDGCADCSSGEGTGCFDAPTLTNGLWSYGYTDFAGPLPIDPAGVGSCSSDGSPFRGSVWRYDIGPVAEGVFAAARSDNLDAFVTGFVGCEAARTQVIGCAEIERADRAVFVVTGLLPPGSVFFLGLGERPNQTADASLDLFTVPYRQLEPFDMSLESRWTLEGDWSFRTPDNVRPHWIANGAVTARATSPLLHVVGLSKLQAWLNYDHRDPNDGATFDLEISVDGAPFQLFAAIPKVSEPTRSLFAFELPDGAVSALLRLSYASSSAQSSASPRLLIAGPP